MDFHILQTVRVAGRSRHIIKGTVRDAPDRTPAKAVVAALDAAESAPTEAGIPWANHSVRAADKVTDAEQPATIPEWTWEELATAAARPTLRQLNVRVRRRVYADCEAAAARAGVPLRQWVENMLENAAATTKAVK